jgi:O-antigen ligase
MKPRAAPSLFRAPGPVAGRLGSPASHAQALLVVAFLFGGGGVGYGLANGIVQITALLLLGINYDAVARFTRHAPRVIVILCWLSLLVPILQLLPLPPSYWQQLPGRDMVVKSLALIAAPSDTWMPASLDPARTLAALLGLSTPMTMVILTWEASFRERTALIRTIIWIGLAGTLLGILQAATGNPLFMLFDVSDGGKVAHGTFANRNSMAVFLNVVLALACGLPLERWPRAKLLLRIAVLLLIVLCTIATMSRSGTALLLVPLAFLALHLWAARSVWLVAPGTDTRLRTVWLGGLAALLAVAVLVAVGGGRLAMTFDRFYNLQDERVEIWKDAYDSAARYWPVGSGMGTFDEVFQADESLEYVTPRTAGRAHNDALELTIEAGILGQAIAFAWLAALALAALLARRRPDRWQIWAACVATTCFALQSGIDYPLRNQINMCLVGALVGFASAGLRKVVPTRSSTLPTGAAQ